MFGSLFKPKWMEPGANRGACQENGKAGHSWEPVGSDKHPTSWRCDRCGSARHESAVWWVRYSRGGKVIRESTGTPLRREAEQFLSTRVDSQRPVIPRVERVTFDELAQLYLDTCKTKGLRDLGFASRCVERLRAHFGGWRVIHITWGTIMGYVAARQGEGYANGTINRDLACLRRMFRLGKKEGKVLLVPEIELLREAPPRQGFLSDLDFLALEAGLPDHLRLPVAFMYTYGWRKEAVLSLTWERVNLREGTVELDARYSKNGEPVMVRLTPTLLERFRGQRQVTVAWVRSKELQASMQDVAARVPWVFHRDGRRIKGFRKAWLRACAAINRPGLMVHDMRRSAARNYDRRGISRSVAMKMAGWKTDAIYTRYRIVSDEDLREAAAKLETGAFAAALPPDTSKRDTNLSSLPYLASAERADTIG